VGKRVVGSVKAAYKLGKAAKMTKESAEQIDEVKVKKPDYSLDPPGYAKRVRHYEKQGLTTSDAQGAADADHMQGRLNKAPQPLKKPVKESAPHPTHLPFLWPFNN
jgi:hypothetical protein